MEKVTLLYVCYLVDLLSSYQKWICLLLSSPNYANYFDFHKVQGGKFQSLVQDNLPKGYEADGQNSFLGPVVSGKVG